MLPSDTFQQQSLLASYCRQGQLPEMRGIHQNNIKQYRRLVYNIVDDMLQNAYPITYDFLAQEEWDDLVNDFFSHHPCQSPQVWYMPKEFLMYHQHGQQAIIKNYPFLLELLWFEWLEVELFMMEDKEVSCKKRGNLLSDKLVLNPEHSFQHFRFPVHRKKPSEIVSGDEGHYFLVLHRDPLSGRIDVTEVAAPALRMLELLAQEPSTVMDILAILCKELDLSLTEEMKAYAVQFLQNAVDSQLVLGYQHVKD